MSSQDQGSSSSETPTSMPSLDSIEMNPNDGHGSGNRGTVVPTILPGQGRRTGSGPRLPDLNEPLQLPLEQPRTERSSGNEQIQAAGGSSCPVMIGSGSAGHVVEQTINREVLPTNAQSGLLCKRRTPEMPQPPNNVLSIPTTANSSNSSTRVARSQLHVAAPPIQIGQTDNFQRNTRLRTTVNQRNPGPASVSTWNPRNFNVQQTIGRRHHQRPVFSPLGPFPMQNLQQMSAPANPSMLHQQQQRWRPIVEVPSPLRAPLSSQYRNGPTMSARGRLSFGSPVSMIQSANMQPNMNLVNGSTSFLRNVGASSEIQSGRGMYNSSFSSLGYRQPSMAEQTAPRMQYFLDSSEAWRMANNYPVDSNGYADLGQLQVQIVNGAIAAARLGGNSFLLSRTTVSQVAEQRRRLISQLRNYLRLVRRTGGLRMEDASEMGRIFLQGMYALENGNDDMPLYSDNMSFEGLLDVGEPIGSSGTGLRVATIRAYLRRRRFLPITPQPTAEAEKCCICQEDYASGEELGKLNCGHDFHFNCIKRWLRRKNLCPICKKIGLAI